MSDVIEFGFDEAKAIKSTTVDLFKQNKNGEKNRVSLVSFRRHQDSVLAKKAQEKGSPLSDQEKEEFITKINAKLSEKLGKPVEALTEVDRLDTASPRFSYAFTHFHEDVGTIRCFSKYEGNTLIEKGPCCDNIGDADQTVGTIVMVYPSQDGISVDEDLFKARKMVGFYVWKLGSKKFLKLNGAYIDSRNSGVPVIDLKVTLDGEAKYQKQGIEATQGIAYWARKDVDAAIRTWILDQGLRLYKYVQNNLGFEMKKDTFLEKMGKSPAATAAETAASLPQRVASYDDLLS